MNVVIILHLTKNGHTCYNDGVGGSNPTSRVTIHLTNGSAFNPFFITNGVTLKIDATSATTLGGGGTPIHTNCRIHLTPGATLAFKAETPDACRSEHLNKINVNGMPAVEGVNITVDPFNGKNGSIIKAFSGLSKTSKQLTTSNQSAGTLLGLGGISLVLQDK